MKIKVSNAFDSSLRRCTHIDNKNYALITRIHHSMIITNYS